MSAPIKTSYDRTILAMAAEGAVTTEVAAAISKRVAFVHCRSAYLGVAGVLTANLRARQAARRAENYRYGHKLFGYQGSRLTARAIFNARVDHRTSDLRHTLRAVRHRADPTAAVPDSFIARVFEAGLTLDDIDAQFGIPPVQAVAAIRHHLEVRP